ncbi:MAG TPA: phosphate acyltransferase, partial [Sphingobacterium sp.]|nr:phosphate acyltransferase [Sphingobacterium sp.]
LAKENVPEEVNQAYNTSNLHFGSDYVIPKPTDPRLITEVSMAVAKAAIASGVARKMITDWDKYTEDLRKRLGKDDGIMRKMTSIAKNNPKRVVFAEADNYKTLRAAQIVKEEHIAIPILLGNREKISELIKEYAFELPDVQIIDPYEEVGTPRYEKYTEHLFRKRQRRGISYNDAAKLMLNRNYFAASMVQFNDADTLISGLTRNYAAPIKPALQVIGTKEGSRIAGMYLMLTSKGPLFLGDTTVNVDPNSRELAEIAVLIERAVMRFNIKPRLAMLSYSNFGSNDGTIPIKVREAVKILHTEHAEIVVDGELQANFALNKDLLDNNFPFSTLKGEAANTLIFPNLESGNIAYKLLQEVGDAEAVGPILLGMNRPVHVLQLGSSVREIVNMVTIAVVDAQAHETSNT